jgi:hypothetical protein
MLKVFVSGALVFLSLTVQAKIDETWYSIPTAGTSSITRSDDVEDSVGTSIKGERRMGLSTTFAGAIGLAGLAIDLNLTERFSYSIGLGGARGFQSFNMNIRNYFSSNNFQTYFTAGYSRWYSSSGDKVTSTSPPFMAKKFLSAKERASGNFSENIIYPGLGAQYISPSGEWKGFGFYFEALYLLDIEDFEAAPTAGLGATYLF